MKTVRLTVNGEPHTVHVPARTQLAELLRNHLHLTGTHLGCEHGVCGACTVLMGGKPIRSCITYAPACDDANVVTVEGLKDDPVGEALRDAFSRHHALQCGFCTPGLLITAWDIVKRLAPASEAVIRRELSGNLCRCSGYMGIVAAVREVAESARGARPSDSEAAARRDGTTPGGPAARGGETASTTATREPSAPAGNAFEPFEVDPVHLRPGDAMSTAPAGSGAARTMTREGGWTRFEREFAMEQPPDALWALFEDLPRVAACLPGVSLSSVDADRFTGTAAIRFGPIGAAFDGKGTRATDAANRTGTIAGRGRDSRGNATLDAELRYAMSEAEASAVTPRTRIRLEIRFRIQGGLAQFSRTDLVEGFADVVLAEFVRNCERALAGKEVPRSPGALALLWRMVKAKLGF